MGTTIPVQIDDGWNPYPFLRFHLASVAFFNRTVPDRWIAEAKFAGGLLAKLYAVANRSHVRLFAAPLSVQQLKGLEESVARNLEDRCVLRDGLVADYLLNSDESQVINLLDHGGCFVANTSQDCGRASVCMQVATMPGESSSRPIIFSAISIAMEFDSASSAAVEIEFYPGRSLLLASRSEGSQIHRQVVLRDLRSEIQILDEGLKIDGSQPRGQALVVLARNLSLGMLFWDGVPKASFELNFDLLVDHFTAAITPSKAHKSSVGLRIWNKQLTIAEAWVEGKKAAKGSSNPTGIRLVAQGVSIEAADDKAEIGSEMDVVDVQVPSGTSAGSLSLSVDDTAVVYLLQHEVFPNSKASMVRIRHFCWQKGSTSIRLRNADGTLFVTWRKSCAGRDERDVMQQLRGYLRSTGNCPTQPSSVSQGGKILITWVSTLAGLDFLRGILLRHRFLKRGARFYQRLGLQRTFLTLLAGWIAVKAGRSRLDRNHATGAAIGTLPFISVVVPCHSQGRFLADALNSVLMQTFRNWELVIVDDGSSDNCHDVANAYKARFTGLRIRSYTKPNGGLSSARNFGIERSVGPWICALDADDYLDREYLMKVARIIMSDPGVDMIYANQQFFFESYWKWYTPQYSRNETLYSGQFPVNTVYRREDWNAVGGYTEILPWGNEDHNLWISLTGLRPNFRVHRIPEFLLYYRYKARSMQRDLARFPEVVAMLHTMHPNEYPVEQIARDHLLIVTEMNLATVDNLQQRLLRSRSNVYLLHLWIGMYYEGIGQSFEADNYYDAAEEVVDEAVKWQVLYRRGMLPMDLAQRHCSKALKLKPALHRLETPLRCRT